MSSLVPFGSVDSGNTIEVESLRTRNDDGQKGPGEGSLLYMCIKTSQTEIFHSMLYFAI
jgi:hypothetical protein